MKTTIYSKHILISLLKEWEQINGMKPTVKQIDDDVNMPSSMAYRNHFWSWSNAITEAWFQKYIPIPKWKTKWVRNKNWVSVQVNKYWYLQIFEPEHPLARKNWYVAIHRKNAFDSWKFEWIENPLLYDVHHIDDDKTNNYPINLQVVLKWVHTTLHTKWKKRPRKGSKKCLTCDILCKSKYWLCTKCYKREWSKIKNWTSENPELLTNP